MIIKELVLNNFGKFSEKQFVFGEGINVIFGANEAGKTTVYTAIGAMLFGLDKQRGRAARTDAYTTYQPWENKTWYEGRMRFSIDNKIFVLDRNFYHGEKSVRLICETDGEELSVEQGDLQMLLGDANAELFFNTVAVGQLKTKPQDVIYDYLKNFVAGAQEQGNQGTDVVKALGILEKRKKELEQKHKKELLEIREELAKCDARLELLEQEVDTCRSQLDALERQKASQEKERKHRKRSFWEKFIAWLKVIFFRKKQKQENADEGKESLRRLEEKQCFYRELLGEREALREEVFQEKDFLYKKMQKQPETQTLKAISLAMERIQSISVEQREEVLERLMKKASEVLCMLTEGKYRKLLLEEGRQPAVWDGRRKLQLFQVSTGCVDQIYLALRIALQDLFFEEEQLPLIFDDAFAYFDDERLERLLGYLQGLDHQVLIFSCHKREVDILERRGFDFVKISL